MKPTLNNSTQTSAGFDLARLSKSKEIVDLASNTLRAWERAGAIHFYRRGKTVFFSKSEVAAFIMGGAQ